MSAIHLAFVDLARVTILLGTTPASVLLITCKSMEGTTVWVCRAFLSFIFMLWARAVTGTDQNYSSNVVI